MFSFLRSLGLQPIEWEQAVKLSGQASPSTLEVVKAGLGLSQCAVVLFTGDDEARLRPEFGKEQLKYQPRPNVIFEAGWAMAQKQQERTILLRFGEVRELSDLSGLNVVNIDNSPDRRNALVQRLKIAGCHVDETASDYLKSDVAGNFELPLEDESVGPDVLSRGGHTDFVVDSTLSHSLNNLDLYTELCNYLSQGGATNLKYNYLGTVCAYNWLALSQDPTYGHSDLNHIIEHNAAEIVRAAGIEGTPVDFISLGPGDGIIDVQLLNTLQQSCKLSHYYPLDLSFELLQRAVSTVLGTPWLSKNFKIKAVHGDFTRLSTYKPIFAFDPAVNFVSLIGYSLGNYNEAELLGKLREGMEMGDLLLLDARLHQLGQIAGKRLSKSDSAEILINYNHPKNNRFAFGPLETATLAALSSTDIGYEVNSRLTAVPNALNIFTYCKNLVTKFRRDDKKLSRSRLDLAVTTLYDAASLTDWLQSRGFEMLWQKVDRKTVIYLLRKSD